MVTGHILHLPGQVLAGHQDLLKSMLLGYLSPTLTTKFCVLRWHRGVKAASWREANGPHTLNHNNPGAATTAACARRQALCAPPDPLVGCSQ